MSLTDWEVSMSTAADIKLLAEKVVAAPEYSAERIEVRHGLMALANAIEQADPSIPPHQLAALLRLIGAGVDQLLPS